MVAALFVFGWRITVNLAALMGKYHPGQSCYNVSYREGIKMTKQLKVIDANQINLIDKKTDEEVATIRLAGDESLEVVFWHPAGPNSATSDTAFRLSDKGLTLSGKDGDSEIRFSFDDENKPKIELVKDDEVIWSTEMK